MPAAIDPPIIVTGGGGDDGGGGGGGTPTPSKKVAKNVITVSCDPADSKSPKRFKTKINKDAEITGVLIEFPNMPDQKPITISGYGVYNIKITFSTAPSSARITPKPPPRRKAKKAAAKRPAARKGK